MKLTRTLSTGLHVPSFSADELPSPAAYTEFFRQSEALGFDAIWTEDRILHPVPMLDSMLLLGWAAAHTTNMTLGTAVMAMNLRRAAVVARQVSTLAHLSGDRFVLGASLGGRPDEYAAVGVPMSRRVAVFRDGIKVLTSLLSGEELEHFTSIPGVPPSQYAQAAVRPAAKVPLLIGGVVDAAVRRAGELADGWVMAPFGSLDQFRHRWELVQQAAIAAGRSAETLVAGRLIYVCVDDDRSRARETLRRFLAVYYGDLLNVDRDGIYGAPCYVAERLREQTAAGITHLMLGFPTLDIAHLERFANDVMPAIRSA